ncbi:hypothetical protein GWI33_010646 [Rhynchophorus ferrugineus]|uniref:Uncharacterized protein n=1 Tax=Rhynchophorus ferrugineus TaxID=354439 RepID=A0A834IUP0_RHYFE|nr:hypothetical protein GWI33_010646 [Rhynchophorus ferrugineus]
MSDNGEESLVETVEESYETEVRRKIVKTKMKIQEVSADLFLCNTQCHHTPCNHPPRRPVTLNTCYLSWTNREAPLSRTCNCRYDVLSVFFRFQLDTFKQDPDKKIFIFEMNKTEQNIFEK